MRYHICRVGQGADCSIRPPVALIADNIGFPIVIGILRVRCLGGIETMRCPSCNAENQPSAKFCVECGTAFPTPCVKCGFKNPPAAKFCQECGVALSAP